MRLHPGKLPTSAKVFGIGLSRTGTKSLSFALHLLGIDVAHFPDDETTLNELAAANYRFSILETLDGITDITVAHCYPELDRCFPGSKFILTVRDQASWLASLEKHWAANPCFDDARRISPEHATHKAVRRLLCMAVFGSYVFDRDRAIDTYNQHLRSVKQYFAHRPEDLLILDVCAGDRWTKLCQFLGKPLPAQPFPYVRREAELATFVTHHQLAPLFVLV